MLTSTVGFLNLSTDNTQPNVPTPNDSTNQVTQVSYEASSVESKVIQLFPSGVFIAKADYDSVAEANAKLTSIDGVATVLTSQFVDPQPGRPENFRAELRFTDVSVIPGVIERLSAAEGFSGAQVFPQALISLPKDVEFSNPDLGLTQEYTFPNPQTQAFITSQTREGDDILVTLNATFRGQTLVNVLAVEQSNLTIAGNIYFTGGSYKISSLSNNFLVRTTVPFTKKNALDSIKSSIDSEFGSQILVQPVSSEIKFTFDDANSFFEEDLNTFLSTYQGIDSFRLDLSNDAAYVTHADPNNFIAFRGSLNSEFNSLGFRVFSVDDPKISLQGNVSAEDREAFFEKTNALASENDVELEILQEAIIDANSIFVEDANTSFELKSGSFTAFVSNDKKTGDEIMLSILLSANDRDGITDIQAQEIVEITG